MNTLKGGVQQRHSSEAGACVCEGVCFEREGRARSDAQEETLEHNSAHIRTHSHTATLHRRLTKEDYDCLPHRILLLRCVCACAEH